MTNFDNIFYSLLVVFQSVTLEGWSVIMVQVQKVFNILSLFFFIPLVFIGAFFLLNLTLVVIKSKFTEEHEANKQRKKRMRFLMKKVTKKDLILQAEAKLAFKRAKAKNQKIRSAKVERKDSDDSRAENRHKRNMAQLRHDHSFAQNYDSNQDSRGTTDINPLKPQINMRPFQGISGINGIKKVNKYGEPITEEISNSELSIINQNNIFYLSNLSGKGNENKDRNIIYLKKGKGKIRMEGMYGITKIHEGKNELGSNSDLLGDIPLSNDEGEIDNGSDQAVSLRDSEIMLPLDSSLSENIKHIKKEKNQGEGESFNKEAFSISNSSYDFENGESKLSPDIIKNNKLDRKNTNYFTGTNLSSNEVKTTAKKGFKSNTLRKGTYNDKGEHLKGVKVKSTRITSKIEGGSKFDKTPLKSSDSKSKLKNFDIKNILFSLIKRKQDELNKNNKQFDSSGEGDDNTEEKKHDKQDTDLREEDLDEIEANKIQVVKKGMKLKIKRDVKFNQLKDTPIDDIIRAEKRVETEEKLPKIIKSKHFDKPPRTQLAPHSLMRELELNEVLLEGKIESDEDEDEPVNNEEIKKGETKNLDEKKEEDDTASEHANMYLEKFKFPYRSNMIATGTISLVVTLKNTESFIDIPNPCAESHGAILVDDVSEEEEEEVEESKSKVLEKKLTLKRNDTLLPNGLLRQNTSTSKGMSRKAKTTRRMLAHKNIMKRRTRDEEEYSEDNVLKKIMMDIPELSQFFSKIDTDQFKREQEEEDKLNEGEEDNENDMYYSDSERENEDFEDIFLDRDIDFDKEMKRACKATTKRRIDNTEWSGQDIKINYDPFFAKIAVSQLSTSMVYPYGILGTIVKLRGYL